MIQSNDSWIIKFIMYSSQDIAVCNNLITITDELPAQGINMAPRYEQM